MLEKRKRRLPWMMIGVGVILTIVLLSTKTGNKPLDWIEKGFYQITTPFNLLIYTISSEIKSLWQNYIALIDTRAQNLLLQSEIAELKADLNWYMHSAIQFERLREQLGFKAPPEIPTVFAEVVGASSDSFHQVLLINKGSASQIRRNQAVVLKEGVVGRIQSVSPHQSLVQLITDFRHRFPVTIQPPPQTESAAEGTSKVVPAQPGIAAGTSAGVEVTRIPLLANIQPGDLVITNGLAGLFPKGLMIGTVERTRRLEHELRQVAEIKPAVDFLRIEGVYVLLADTQYELLPVAPAP